MEFEPWEFGDVSFTNSPGLLRCRISMDDSSPILALEEQQPDGRK